jgi:hypothetical protein
MMQLGILRDEERLRERKRRNDEELKAQLMLREELERDQVVKIPLTPMERS